MMRVVYPICCGLDVHKKVIVETIVTTNKDGIPQYKQHSFSTSNSDLQKFHDWLIQNNCKHVCMESTSKYWIPIFNVLEQDIDVCLTHPKYIKVIKGKKTDKKDLKWIADLYRLNLVRCSFIPPKTFRQLREIARYRFKLICTKSSEKNRMQNCMTVSNIAIANVLSDPFGKTGTDFGFYLKPFMVQCTLAAIRSKKDPYFAIKYSRIKKRRGHKKAIVAIARMMMVCIFHIISGVKPFHPVDYEEITVQHMRPVKVELNDQTVFAYLQAKGYDTSKLVICNDS